MYVQVIRFWVVAQSCLEELATRAARPQRAATMVEYGLVVALVAIAAMVAVKTLGTTISGVFTNISGHIAGAG